MPLRALAFNCTLRSSSEPSSTQLLLRHLAERLERHDVITEIVRVVDHHVKPGVSADEGEGDAWPELRRRLLEADIFILGTPIWLGAPSSIAKRVVERLDAMLSETDDANRMPTFGKVALVATVGNEDGAHHVAAECFQWLGDTGFTIPPAGAVYWVGEAMKAVDYKDLDETPEEVAGALDLAASNAAHLATLLRGSPFPGTEG